MDLRMNQPHQRQPLTMDVERVLRLERERSVLHVKIATLQDELTHAEGDMREAVYAAFKEGFVCGVDHDNLSWKYPPMGIAWLESDSRAAAEYLPLTTTQRAAITAWGQAKIDDQHDCEEMP